MYIWTGADVDSQLGEIKELTKRAEGELGFVHSNFTLPLHVSLKMSFYVDDKTNDRRRYTAMVVIKGLAVGTCAIRRSIVLAKPDIRRVWMLSQPIHGSCHDEILEFRIGEADSPMVVGMVGDAFTIDHRGPFRMRLEDFRAHETP